MPRPQNGPVVCGQAHAVLDNLSRTRTLPTTLSLSIEEILEEAWELAYRHRTRNLNCNVIALPVEKKSKPKLAKPS